MADASKSVTTGSSFSIMLRYDAPFAGLAVEALGDKIPIRFEDR